MSRLSDVEHVSAALCSLLDQRRRLKGTRKIEESICKN